MTKRSGGHAVPWRRPVGICALGVAMIGAGPAPAAPVDFGQELEAFLRVPAVVGRERQAGEFLAARLAGLPVRTDSLGNVVLQLGSGEPRRLVVCPLGEPGLVVSRIEPDGYLRLAAVGPALGPLWEQAHAGHVVMIEGARGPVPGAVAIPSIHLQAETPNAPSAPPFAIDGAYVDVGAESAGAVADLGVRMLDPVALLRQPVRLAHDLIAAPAARVKAGCLATVEAARELHQALAADPAVLAGSVVFAWTTLDLLNGAGLEYLLHQEGPFAAAIDLGWGFGWELEHDRPRPVVLPHPETGLLSDGPLPIELGGGRAPAGSGRRGPRGPGDQGVQRPGDRGLQVAAFVDLGSRPRIERWGSTRVAHLGLPALYPGSPVETVALRDAKQLSALLVASLCPAAAGPTRVLRPPLAAPPAALGASSFHERQAEILGRLISRHGVSGDEGEVRAEVVRQLPGWAKPVTDASGNLIVTIGSPRPGSTPVLFMAHLDEVGFRVHDVLPDGRLALERRGGIYPSIWEAQPALVHGENGLVAGVFEPRPDWLSAEHGPVRELTVSLGATSAAEVRALGVKAGSGVTMPKQLLRLGPHRAMGRSMDDRVGSSALLLALQQLAAATLGRQVTFAWTVGEEVGLEGSRALAGRLKRQAGEGGAALGAAAGPLPAGALLRVYPVDTFVSSDSPLESRRLAYAALGEGPVLRAMDGASYVPRELVDRARRIAREHEIPLQAGRTGGATDGVPFISFGADVLPISWPGRYSHSPVEVSDLRDVENLVKLIVALAEAAD